MITYYKAIRPDGTSFYDPSFAWATKPGGITTHPKGGDTSAASYLSVSTAPTDCTGMSWPCRLLEVEAVGDAWSPDESAMPNKRAGLVFRTVRELPAHDVFGPQGKHVSALIERWASLTQYEVDSLRAAWDAAWSAARHAAWDAARDAARDSARHAAWDAAWDAAWSAARHAARHAAWSAAWDAAWSAAWDAAWGLIVRDLISAEHYETLTRPWREVIGSLHPDDADLQEKP